jgi:hypothetical protein
VLTDTGTRLVPRQFAGLFHGALDLSEHDPLGPLGGGRITFDDELCEDLRRLVLLGYCADQPRGCGPGIGTCAACRGGGDHDQ